MKVRVEDEVVAAAVELGHNGDGVMAEGAAGLAVCGFVLGEEVAPGVVDDLTSSMLNWLRRVLMPLVAAPRCQRGEARGRRGR